MCSVRYFVCGKNSNNSNNNRIIIVQYKHVYGLINNVYFATHKKLQPIKFLYSYEYGVVSIRLGYTTLSLAINFQVVGLGLVWFSRSISLVYMIIRIGINYKTVVQTIFVFALNGKTKRRITKTGSLYFSTELKKFTQLFIDK